MLGGMVIWRSRLGGATRGTGLNAKARQRDTDSTAKAPGRKLLREREASQRRSAMLTAVRKLLQKGGVQAVTMRAVADAVGASTTMVYALFPDKAAMIAQSLDKDLKKLSRHLLEASQGGASATEKLRRVAHAYVAHGMAHPLQYRLVFMEPRPPSAVEDSTIEQGNVTEDAYALVCALVVDMLAEQGIALPQQGIETVTQIVWESMHGLVALRICTGDDPWINREAATAHLDLMLDVLLQGIAARWKGAGARNRV